MSKVNILKLAKDLNEPKNTELEFLRALAKLGIESARVQVYHKSEKHDNTYLEIIVNDISGYDIHRMEKFGFYHLVTRPAPYFNRSSIEVTFMESRIY